MFLTLRFNKHRPFNKTVAPGKNQKIINVVLCLFRTLEYAFHDTLKKQNNKKYE